MERFLTPAEAGRLLGLTAAGVRRLHEVGDLLIAATTEGGIRLFKRADVLACARERQKRKEASRG